MYFVFLEAHDLHRLDGVLEFLGIVHIGQGDITIDKEAVLVSIIFKKIAI